ncbi:MAG: hypothetical protein ABTD50_10155 [Polyangiaceae bacterium]|jgi:hypothetical protein
MGVYLDEVGVYPDEVGVSSDEVGVSSDEVGVSSDEVGVSSDEVGVSSDEVGVSSDDIGLYPDGIGVSSDGIGVSSDGVGVSPDEVDAPLEKTGVSLRLVRPLSALLQATSDRTMATPESRWTLRLEGQADLRRANPPRGGRGTVGAARIGPSVQQVTAESTLGWEHAHATASRAACFAALVRAARRLRPLPLLSFQVSLL